MRIAVLVFPGSNCDHDCYHVLKHTYRQQVEFVWHKQTDLKGFDAVIVPGGFSYGDYLRTGAIARVSPVMRAVERFGAGGGHILGICNGFQILLEAGLLPGAMLRNRGLKFICRDVFVRMEGAVGPLSEKGSPGRVIRIPIAHAEGNYYAEEDTLREVEANGQVILRYCDSEGRITEEANPNGSTGSIAGISNREGNILGMMPHPERCADPLLGGTDGRFIFEPLLAALGASPR